MSQAPSNPFLPAFTLALLGGVLGVALAPVTSAQEPPPAQWLRLDPLPAEMPLAARESFDGVPPRFVLLTDGSVFVGGRREVLRGQLDKAELQGFATDLDLVVKSFGNVDPPATISWGEGPPLFRFSVLLGSTFQVGALGVLPDPGSPPLRPLAEFIRRLAGFRHPSLRPYDPEKFAMITREKTLPGGCRHGDGLPALSQSVGREWVVPASLTLGFPTGAEISQVCEGTRRYAVVFRPVIPGAR